MVLKDLQPSFSLSISNYPSLQPQRFWILGAIPLVIYLIPWGSFSLPQIIQQGQTSKTALPQKNLNPLNLDSIRAKKNTADSIKRASVKQSVFFKTGVLADKTKKTFYLTELKNNKWEIIATYPMARGRKDGDKTREGDLKTPEGLYFIKQISAGENIGPLYGALIFKLNYPNRDDLNNRKTGSGIWIHGVEFGAKPTFTKGCLSLSNQDVIKLTKHLRFGSPVFIAKNIDSTKIDQYLKPSIVQKQFVHFNTKNKSLQSKEDLKPIFEQAFQFAKREKNRGDVQSFVRAPVKTFDKLEKNLKSWASSWSSQDVTGYAKHYHPKFTDKKGRRLKPYLERKKTIFASKDSIKVIISQIEVQTKNDTLVRVRFFQDYSAFSGNKKQNWKREKSLYFALYQNKWLINKE
jgi:murein L,D-transpeptidase YafK